MRVQIVAFNGQQTTRMSTVDQCYQHVIAKVLGPFASHGEAEESRLHLLDAHLLAGSSWPLAIYLRSPSVRKRLRNFPWAHRSTYLDETYAYKVHVSRGKLSGKDALSHARSFRSIGNGNSRRGKRHDGNNSRSTRLCRGMLSGAMM